MTQLTGNDYLDTPQLLREALTVLTVPRTGQPLATTRAGLTLSYRTTRVAYAADLTSALPVIVIDINPHRSVQYRYTGSVLERGVPLALGVYTPNTAYLDGLTAAQVQAEVTAADTDLKTLVGDLEQLLNREEVRRRVAKHVEILSARLLYDDLALEEQTHVRVRYAELWLVAWNPVAGH